MKAKELKIVNRTVHGTGRNIDMVFCGDAMTHHSVLNCMTRLCGWCKLHSGERDEPGGVVTRRIQCFHERSE